MHVTGSSTPPDEPIEDRVEWLAYVVSNFVAMNLVYMANGITDLSEANHEYLQIEVELQRETMMPTMRKRAAAWVEMLDESFFINARQPN